MAKRIKPKHAKQIREGLAYYRQVRPKGSLWTLGSVGDILRQVNDAPELTQRAFDRQLEKEAQR